MENEKKTYIATFRTHFGAIRFKKACVGSGIDAQLMAVPRALSDSCGNCVQFVADAVPDFPEGIMKDVGRIVRVTSEGYLDVLGDKK